MVYLVGHGLPYVRTNNTLVSQYATEDVPWRI